MTLFGKEEKKVEYLELVYDLIFVYIVGRNNALMHNFENGFTTLGSFAAYVFCTLAIIQIWMFSTFYINLYGRNSVRDYVFLFTNMYLLYHMSTGISTNWTENSYRFCIAWALILINIAVQHFIEARHHKAAPWELKQIYRRGGIILIEALLVVAITVFYAFTGISLTYIPVIFGIAATALSGRTNMLVPVDFGHLSERAMLYIVFTFGEMIIVISSYFDGKITPNSLYFSLMAFLIVVGLLLSYGVLYNRIIDRDKTTNGTLYMLIHVFLIFALNNISVALEFMRDEEVANFPKTLFLTGSFVLCFTFMFLLGFYAKKRCGFNRKFALVLTGMMISFAALMLIFRENMYVNIAISAAYVFGVFAMLYYRGKRMEA
ncbi:MAG: low temperature requirement protein A [Oscillospiraceae bacterium]|nr:low temperature requirement protein A [Oscillospiraceae bacterium]